MSHRLARSEGSLQMNDKPRQISFIKNPRCARRFKGKNLVNLCPGNLGHLNEMFLWNILIFCIKFLQPLTETLLKTCGRFITHLDLCGKPSLTSLLCTFIPKIIVSFLPLL